ncbi:MAG TPA: hypothetical protein VHT70_05600 [Candidatus Saccharimonadales bacterium]|jgi:hypothetical protein|nr:hypothetical protein [Candidatus Saccharimonadales bacterium]
MMESGLPNERPELPQQPHTEGYVPSGSEEDFQITEPTGETLRGEGLDLSGLGLVGQEVDAEPYTHEAADPTDEGEHEVAYQPPVYEDYSGHKEDPNGPPSEEELKSLSGLLGQIEPDVQSYSSPYERISTNMEHPEELREGQVIKERLSIWGESQGGKGFEGPTSDIYVTQDAQDGSTHVIRRDNVTGKQHELNGEQVHRLNYSLQSNEGRSSYSPFDENPDLGPRPEVRHWR